MKQRIKENKFLIIPFLAFIVIGLIFVSTQIPVTNTSPKDLPIGLVTEDKGEMGKTLFAMLEQQMEQMDNDSFKFIFYNSEEKLNEALSNQEVYGAFIIPKDFSEKFKSLQSSSPTSPTLKIVVNQGMNANASAVVSTALSNIATQINSEMSKQILQKLSQAHMTLPPTQVSLLAAPIQTETIMVNKVKELGSASTAFFQPTWITSIMGGVMFYLAGRNRTFVSKGDVLRFRGLQSLLILIYGFLDGYLITWATTWILDFEFNNFHTMALYVSLASIAFTALIFATVTWLTLPSIILYILLMFFGLPLLQLAPEMVPEFYQDYVYPWLPMKFLINGVKDILYFGQDLSNSNSTVLLWIAIIAFLVCWVKFIIEKPKEITN